MQVTYNEAAYLDNDQSKECYLNATDAAYDYGKEIDSTSTCSLTVRVKILDGNNYNTTCTSFYIKSSVWDHAQYFKAPLALLLAIAMLTISV